MLMRNLGLFCFAFFLAGAVVGESAAAGQKAAGKKTETDKYEGTLDIFESVASVQPFFEDAYAYAVFPRVAKGGLFFIGGARGKGRVY
ncbi:MAG: hypothetical protein ACR2PJ_06720, partial [Pseudomonadales bacterium]